MPNQETIVQRKNTKVFIDADPITVVLTPMNQADSGDGGFKLTSGDPLTPQVFRLIPTSDIMPTVTTPDGVQLIPRYVLLGEFDAEMPRWSLFTVRGVDFQIVSPTRPDFRDPDRDYFTRCDVARR